MKSSPFKSVLLILILVCPAMGQPLADRVPGDAIVYLGWRGSATMPAGYENTHLKAVLDNSKVREFVTDFIPQAIAKMSGPGGPNIGQMAATRMVLTQLWSKPTAFFFSGLDMTNPQSPMPRLALICQAGNDAAMLRQQINILMADARNSPVRVQDISGTLVISIGYADSAAALASAADSLLRSPGFAGALKQVQADPMVICYADIEKALAMLDQVMAQAPPGPAAMVPRVIDALGLRGVKRIIQTSGFDGRDWMSQGFAEVPAPRTGLAQMLDSRPISPDLLKMIPADSTFAASLRFDPAKLLTLIREAVGQIDPQAQQYFDQGVGAVQIALARNPITDILEPMGQDWGVYCSPTIAGNGVLGMVVVNRLDDPAKAQSSLPTAAVNVSNWASVALRQFNAPVEITGRSTEIGGQRIYYIGSPVIAPAWSLKEGNLYLGLFPQPVAAGTRWSARGAKPITENEKFVALQKRLGVSNPISFSFYDLETTSTQSGIYQQLMVLARYAGVGDMFGVPLPEPLLPPLDVMSQHMGPAGSFAWVDDTGYHTKALSPFPGAKLFSEPGLLSEGGAAVGGLMVSILLPSLNRARETANRVKCAANLKSIGQGMLLYANENRGRYPQSIGELMRTQDMFPEVFLCPSSDSEIPANVRQQGRDAIIAWVEANTDYVYLGRGKTAAAGPDDIIVYEKPNNHDNQGINMLFGDGHVDFVMMQQALRMIDRQAPAGAR